jgi:hypothetical protein
LELTGREFGVVLSLWSLRSLWFNMLFSPQRTQRAQRV